MTKPVVVLNVVGLTEAHIGEHTPNISKLLKTGHLSEIEHVLPAVTCSVQATYLTGLPPSEHGIVGNGWYFKDQSEIRFWHQSHKLLTGEKIWQAMRKRDPNATCANLFWWYNMYSDVDYSITPRPMYPADGRKIPDIYTQPPEWRDELNDKLGQFPLFNFWGPTANIVSSRWIADATLLTLKERNPTLTLVYLPHLDYSLQKLGPNHSQINEEIKLIDHECGRIIDAAHAQGREVIILSEYGISNVNQPIHLNRLLREKELITVRTEMGRELLDAGASKAFAVADHQIAHIYLNDQSYKEQVKRWIEAVDGVEQVLDEAGIAAAGLDHPRSGDLIAIAKPDAWFTYYYWLDEHRAPDFATTVDIHRKPGYDPVELFVNPKIRVPIASIGWRLVKKKLGFRTLMDVIPTDAHLVKGSHGANPQKGHGPILISSSNQVPGSISATQVKSFVLQRIFRDELENQINQ